MESITEKNSLIEARWFSITYCVWSIFFFIRNTLNFGLAKLNGLTTLLNLITLTSLLLLIVIKVIRINIYNRKNMWIFLSLLLFIGIKVSFNSDGLTMVVILIFIIAAVGIDYNLILRTYLFYSITLVSLTILLNKIGVLKSYTTYDFRFRDSLGFSYLTYGSQYIFYIICSYIIIRGSKLKFIEVLLLEIINFYIYHKTGTSNPFIVSTTILIISYIYLKRGKELKNKLVEFWLSFSFPISFMIFWTFLFKISSNLFIKLDKLFHTRLSLSKNAILIYGIKPFGQKIIFNTQGTVDNIFNRYDYVDSSYIQMLLLSGWIFTILILYGFTVLTIRLVKNKKYLLAIILSGIAIHSMFDPQLLYLWFSPYSLLIGNGFSNIDLKLALQKVE